MKKKRIGTVVFAVLAVLALAACDVSFFQPSAAQSATVGFDFDLAAVFAAPLGTNEVRATALDAAPITGTLTATKIGPDGAPEGIPVDYTWYASIDEAEFTIASTKTIILTPGYYNFSLVFDVSTNPLRRYAGATDGNVTIVDGTNDIEMTIAPIIGDTDIDGNVVEFIELKFSYLAGELSQLEHPHLRVWVDSEEGPTDYLELLDPNGVAIPVYVNAGDPAEAHTVRLELYETYNYYDPPRDYVQVGKSIPSQETINNEFSQPPFTMDLIPLYGETAFVLGLEGGSATFSFNIPTEIVDEVGGLPNLFAEFTVAFPPHFYDDDGERVTRGSGPTFDSSLENPVVFSGNEIDGYTGTITFTSDTEPYDFEYGSVDMSIVFSEKTVFGDGDDDFTQETVATAIVTNFELTEVDSTTSWTIELRRRAYVTGIIWAVVGVNVYNHEFVPVEGAIIAVDGDPVALTTGDGFGTPGYLKLTLPAGTYEIGVWDPNLGGLNVGGYVESTSVDTGLIANIDLILP